MGEDLAELIVAHLADESAAATERGEACNGVGGRAARHLQARAHGVVECLDLIGRDQGHGALGQAVAVEKAVLGMTENVDDCIADAENVDVGLRHGGLFDWEVQGGARSIPGDRSLATLGEGTWQLASHPVHRPRVGQGT